MNCSYCGEEIKDRWSFCMHCGTKVGAQEEPEGEAPCVEEPVFVPSEIPAPEFDLPREEPVGAEPVTFQARKITIDPEKFEFHPEVRDEPVSKSVSSWELIPAHLSAPKLELPTKRSLCKMIFLGLVTLGIYPMVIWSRIITELNIAASRYDGKRTMTFYGMLMLTPLTLSAYSFVWYHKLCGRISDELQRRGIEYKFGPSVFWLWGVLGSFILVGPFIFTHKLMKSMNFINKDFNENG